MKVINKIAIGLATAVLMFVGCSDTTNAAPTNKEKVTPTISEESLGLRKTDIYKEGNETTGHQAAYSTTYTGSGHKIKRAFQDAPPMIPHDTEGMLPITINDNQCIGCHMPQAAQEMGMGATAIPSSHFLDMRPKHNFDGEMFTKAVDNMKNEVSIKKEDELQGARFNCSQCHAPQSGDDLSVKNTFEADFTSEDGSSVSSWSGTKLMEGLDTTK